MLKISLTFWTPQTFMTSRRCDKSIFTKDQYMLFPFCLYPDFFLAYSEVPLKFLNW